MRRRGNRWERNGWEMRDCRGEEEEEEIDWEGKEEEKGKEEERKEVEDGMGREERKRGEE